jgi:hypothetical protein
MQATDSLIEWSGTSRSTVGICERFSHGVAVAPAYSALPEQEHSQLKEVTESAQFDDISDAFRPLGLITLSVIAARAEI